MNRPLLFPCSNCLRHVRIDSGACPFCGHTALTRPSLQGAPRRERPARRTETLMYLAGTSALALAAAACGGEVLGSEGDRGDAAASAESGSNDATIMDQSVVVTYGLPPPFDAGEEHKVDAQVVDVAEPGDALDEAGCPVKCTLGCFVLPDGGVRCKMPAPAYGSPPPPDPPPK
jgi:hypothetical protein